MKVSRYTFLFSHENRFYIYNTLSNTLMEVDEGYYKILELSQRQKTAIINDLDKELMGVLTDKRFIVENETDEFLLYKSIIHGQRSQTEQMHLTLAPTMDCNFKCHYCFEKKEKTYMTSQVIDSIIKYVTSIKDLKKIHLTWFGGEPLMATDQMEEFYSKFSKQWNREFSSNIITTAYHITDKVIDILKSIKVEDMQITLDGNRDSHNKIKYSDDCEDVFSKVIRNIDLLVEKAPEIHITVRVNLTKENAHEYVSLYKLLTDRYRRRNLGVAPAFVQDRGNDNWRSSKNIFFNQKESSTFVLNLYRKAGIHTPWMRYPERFINECAIRDQRAISFDPLGYAYKCWEIIGNKKYAVGKLEDGVIKNINQTMLNRQLYGADPIEDKVCSKCSYLPLCNGGCPIHRIENEFEAGNIDTCVCYKGFLSDFMKIHLDLKRAGYDNY